MRIAIVDDEQYWREITEKEIKKHYHDIDLEIDLYSSGIAYLESDKGYDISFVDVEMPELDGFDTIKKSRKTQRNGIYIILTTHTDMSRKGYLVNAFRYLDKVELESEMEEALKAAKIVLGRNEKINVNVVGEGQRQLTLKNILYIETEKHNILIHTKQGTKRCSNRMTDMEELLKEKGFYRCHHAFIVNLDEVKGFKESIIYMSNGADVDISKRKIWEFKRVYLKRQYECANG